MAYASITYTSASGTTFALTNSDGNAIEYLRQSDISVTVNGTLQTQGTDYTFNSAGTSIILTSSVSSATVVISRTTTITDATVSFTAGSTLTAQDLNNSDRQNRFALQEFSDIYDSLRTGTGDLGDLGGFIDAGETWVSDAAHAATTNAIDARVDSKIDSALTGDVVAGNAITITDNSPASGQITVAVTDGAIEAAELASNAVTTVKIADSNVTTAKINDSAVTTAKINDAAVTTAKLANDSVTSAKIADGTIIAGDIASNAVTTAKILDANVTTAKIADSNVTTAKINDAAVTEAKIAGNAVTNAKIASGAVDSTKMSGATVVTNSEHSGSTPNDTSFFTTSASDARYFRQDSSETISSGSTWSGSDNFIATTAAIDARIIDLVDDVGGFVPIANETSFPAANPDLPDEAGTIISIKEITTTRTPSGGTVTIANGSGSNTVTINGCGSTVLASGFGVLVETTSTLHTYTFHRLVPKATEVTTVAGIASNVTTVANNASAVTTVANDLNETTSEIETVANSISNVDAVGGSIANVNTVASNISSVNSFANVYRIASSDPTTSLDVGDLVFNTTNNKLRIYNGSSWQDGVTATGDLVSKTGDTMTGALGVTAGTAGSPSLFISGDTNTGIYSPGADQVAISTGGSGKLFVNNAGAVDVSSANARLYVTTTGTNTAIATLRNASYFYNINLDGTGGALTFYNGTERLRITSDGKVGLGTSSPGSILHIDTGSSNLEARFDARGANALSSNLVFRTLTSGGGTTGGHIGHDGTNLVLAGASAVATKHLVITSGGNVGVGVTTPSNKLHLHASDSGVNYLQATNSTTGTASTDGALFGINADEDLIVWQREANNLLLATNNTERARIDSSGRLGIGTSSPANDLDVLKTASGSTTTARIGATAASGANNATLILNNGGTGNATLRFDYEGSTNRASIGVLASDQKLTFGTAGSTAMTIDASQRVGIGTTSPAQVLDVQGGANRTPIAFKGSGTGTGYLYADNSSFGVKTSAGSLTATDAFVGVDTANTILFITSGTEKAKFDSSGRLLVGTSTSANAPVNCKLVANFNEDVRFEQSSGYGLNLIRQSVPTNGQGLSRLQFIGYSTGTTEVVGAQIQAEADGGDWASGDCPGRLEFSTTADGSSSPTRRMWVNSAGQLRFDSSGGGGIIFENSGNRIFFGGPTNASVGTSSAGSGSTTLYIGNAAIQVSSDVRLKENIEDTQLDALDAIGQIKVKDFTWNDPTDTSPNNRNARGKWTGLIAQELVEILPFVVNAPRKEEDGSIDHDSEDRWTLDQSQLCPVLIKAVQQQQEIIASLEARLSALESA